MKTRTKQMLCKCLTMLTEEIQSKSLTTLPAYMLHSTAKPSVSQLSINKELILVDNNRVTLGVNTNITFTPFIKLK